MAAAREQHERTIGPHTYRVTLLGAKEGERMAWKLAKLLMPSAAAAADGFAAAPVKPSAVQGEEGVAEMIAMVIGASWGLTRLIELVDPLELEQMQVRLAQHTEVLIGRDQEKPLAGILDDHFAGHYDWMAQWFAFALEVNFSSFFAVSASADVVGALAKRIVKLMASLSPRPTSTPPTGPSTASSQASSTEARA